MDLSSPIILLLLLGIMGGVVAYFGDWIGRKLGKKRLRLGGIRPRHTAALITVIFGVLIPFATALAIMIISKPVRDWATQGPKIVEERNRLISETASLNKKSNELATQNQDLGKANENLVSTNQQLEQERIKLSQQREKAEKVLAIAKAGEKTALARVTTLTKQESSLKNEIGKLGAEVSKKTNELKDLSTKITSLNSQIKELNQNTVFLAQQVGEAESKLRDAETKAADATKRADSALSAARLAEDRKVAAEAAASNLELRLADLRLEEQNLRRIISGVRESQLLVANNEELSRIVIPGSLSINDARQKLIDLIRNANVQVLDRGIGPFENKPSAALVPREIRGPDGQSRIFMPEEQLQLMAQAISQTATEQVLIAIASLNYFREDSEQDLPVPLEIVKRDNKLLFAKGAAISKTDISANLDDNQILAAVLAFLSKEVRSRALQEGALPINGRTDSIARVTVKQISDLVSQIKRMGGIVELTALAAEDTKVAEPLTLEFKLAKK